MFTIFFAYIGSTKLLSKLCSIFLLYLASPIQLWEYIANIQSMYFPLWLFAFLFSLFHYYSHSPQQQKCVACVLLPPLFSFKDFLCFALALGPGKVWIQRSSRKLEKERKYTKTANLCRHLFFSYLPWWYFPRGMAFCFNPIWNSLFVVKNFNLNEIWISI